jgi:hypothetical protein
MIEEYDNKMIQSFEYETTAISNKNIIGTCELGKATIQMLNDTNEYSALKNQWIKTKFGSFYVYDVKPVQEKVNIKLSCYDIKYKLDSDYDSSLYLWPMTLKEWRNAIYENCNVLFIDDDFPNSDLVLEAEPYVGTNKKNRDVLCLIAQAGASWIETDENDKFCFKWFTNNKFVVKDWDSLTSEKNKTNKVNLVVLGRGNIEDIVYYPKTKPENPVEFKIDNNYIIDPQDTTTTEDLRETTIIPIYNQVKDLEFVVFKMTSKLIDNKLSIKLGDIVQYTDIYGNELESFVMTRKISYLGGDIDDNENYQITLSAEAINETNTDLSKGTNVIQVINETSAKVDKNAKLIELVNSEVNENSSEISKIKQRTGSVEISIEKATTEINKTNENIENNYFDKKSVESLVANAESGITNTFSEAGGNNIFRNTNFSATDVLEENQLFEFWYGNVVRKQNTNAANGYSIMLQNNTLYQEETIANGKYTISFYYKILNSLANVKVAINDKEYELKNTNSVELFQTGVDDIDPINILDNHITLSFISDTDNAAEIYDIMGNAGSVKLAYSQNQNETVTDTVNIGKGISITSSNSKVKLIANHNEICIKNTQTNEKPFNFNENGGEAKNMVVKNEFQHSNLLDKKVDEQVWTIWNPLG